MKTLLVVGGGGSIGSEVVNYFSKYYRIITITHKSVDKDNNLSKNVFLSYYNVDICDSERYKAICDDILLKVNKLDGIIYCSGLTIPGNISLLSLEDWDKSININLKGYWLTVKFLYRLIVDSQTSIVQVNSKTGKRGSYKNSIYASTKFAGIGLTQSLALELAEFGVRVNAVCPGNVFESNTWNNPKNGLFKMYAKTQNSTPEKIREKYIDLVPMKRSCKYMDIINVIEFLLSDKSSYMTGQGINVTGGQQLT